MIVDNDRWDSGPKAGPGRARAAHSQLDFLRGTFAPFFRASDNPMAMACLRLVTLPPLPPLPDFNVPRFSRCIALLTLFAAAFPYRAIMASWASSRLQGRRYVQSSSWSCSRPIG